VPRLALITCIALGTLAGCGADDDQPAPPQTVTPATCPPIAELAPETFALVESGELPALKRLVAERITDAQLSALLDGVITLLAALDPDEREALAALVESDAVTELAPLLLDLVRWVAGEPDDPSTYQLELIGDMRRLVGTCDTAAILGVWEDVVAAPEVPRLLAGLGDVLGLDIVQQVLSAGDALDRDGFTVLVCNILASLVRPGFSVEGDIVRPLDGIDLLPLDEPPLAPFLVDLDALLAPDGAILPVLADLVCCDVYGVPRCSALSVASEPLPRDPVFTWAMHALFTGGVIDIEAALAAAGGLVGDPAVKQTLEPLRVLLERLVADPELQGVVDSLLVTLLEPNTTRPLLLELLTLVDAGAIDELFAVFEALVDGCTPDQLAEPDPPREAG